PLERLVVASSMSIYGEGLYEDSEGNPHASAERTLEQLRGGLWELTDSGGRKLRPVPTPETKQLTLASVYALSKYDQERMCLMVGRTYSIPVVALRLFNVFGPRQALSNPYTGVLAIFASRYLNNRPPVIFEDGNQKRDFVSVYDVARAFRLALERPGLSGAVLNIGSGNAYTIREIAEKMGRVLQKDSLEPVVTGQYRMGDIRHCFADIGLAGDVIGYRPQVKLSDGMAELAEWLPGRLAEDRFDSAAEELMRRGLTV
ncbi:MAG: NAD-dependent epimerase/dehydratase family protein, partial [Candidatus Latescibacterota bacterium]